MRAHTPPGIWTAVVRRCGSGPKNKIVLSL